MSNIKPPFVTHRYNDGFPMTDADTRIYQALTLAGTIGFVFVIFVLGVIVGLVV